jgi:DNA-binding transcriptional regulator YdaS (Cro superfamily)
LGKNINHGVRKAIEISGGTRQHLADLLGCTKEAVRKMEYVNCSADRAVEIETKLESKVTREEIRPDLFIKGYKPDRQPPAIATPSAITRELMGTPKKDETEIVSPPDSPLVEDEPESVFSLEPAQIDNRKSEIAHRIKENPNVDIARPGRKVQTQEQPR